MTTRKATARNTFANHVAPTLTAPVSDVVSVTINGKVVSGSRQMILDILAGSEVKPAAATKPAVVKAKAAPVVTAPATKSEPIDFVAKAKETECFKAARAAAKAAGLAYDPQTKTGGKFGTNREAYYTAFWAGFNAKATEIGLPTRTRKSAE